MSFFFFFNDTATTEIYTLSLHDALPISLVRMVIATVSQTCWLSRCLWGYRSSPRRFLAFPNRSEEHTSELQSLAYLVCRLLLEKKKMNVRDPRLLQAAVALALSGLYAPA